MATVEARIQLEQTLGSEGLNIPITDSANPLARLGCQIEGSIPVLVSHTRIGKEVKLLPDQSESPFVIRLIRPREENGSPEELARVECRYTHKKPVSGRHREAATLVINPIVMPIDDRELEKLKEAVAHTLLKTVLTEIAKYTHNPEITKVEACLWSFFERRPEEYDRLPTSQRPHLADTRDSAIAALRMLGFSEPTPWTEGSRDVLIMKKGSLLPLEKARKVTPAEGRGTWQRDTFLIALTDLFREGSLDSPQAYLAKKEAYFKKRWRGKPVYFETWMTSLRSAFEERTLEAIADQLRLDHGIFAVLQRIFEGDYELVTAEFLGAPTKTASLQTLVSHAEALDQKRRALLPGMRFDHLRRLAVAWEDALAAHPDDIEARNLVMRRAIDEAQAAIPVWAKEEITGLLRQAQGAISENIPLAELKKLVQTAGVSEAAAEIFTLMVRRLEEPSVDSLVRFFNDGGDTISALINTMLHHRKLKKVEKRPAFDYRIPSPFRRTLQALVDEYHKSRPLRTKQAFDKFPFQEYLTGTTEGGGLLDVTLTRLSQSRSFLNSATVQRTEDTSTVSNRFELVMSESREEGKPPKEILHAASTTVSKKEGDETTFVASNPQTDEGGLAAQVLDSFTPHNYVGVSSEIKRNYGALNQTVQLKDGSGVSVLSLYDAEGNYIRTAVFIGGISPSATAKFFHIDLIQKQASLELNKAIQKGRDAAWSSQLSIDSIEPAEGDNHQPCIRLRIKLGEEPQGDLYIPVTAHFQAFLTDTSKLLGEPCGILTPKTFGLQSTI